MPYMVILQHPTRVPKAADLQAGNAACSDAFLTYRYCYFWYLWIWMLKRNHFGHMRFRLDRDDKQQYLLIWYQCLVMDWKQQQIQNASKQKVQHHPSISITLFSFFLFRNCRKFLHRTATITKITLFSEMKVIQSILACAKNTKNQNQCTGLHHTSIKVGSTQS